MRVSQGLAGVPTAEGGVVEDQPYPLIGVRFEAVHAVDVIGATASIEEDIARRGDFPYVGFAEDAMARP